MQVSRRDFLQLTASAGAGTAIGGLVGLGVTLAPAAARAQELRIKDAKTTPSICPFCSVGCATLIHTVNGKIVNIEGDPRSPHNEGTLCPKGAATNPPVASIAPNSLGIASTPIGTGGAGQCGSSCTLSGTAFTFTSGYSYTVTVVTARNNQFSFTVTR